MGNITSEQKKKPLTLQDLTTKIGEYRTINEGDPEMVEDPEFPQELMLEALNKNNTIEGNSVQGTYVYYPNKRKPKMWIGNYKILNPEDILCKNIAEKMGMTELEWKNYIERKKKIQETRKTDNLHHFDHPSSEQPIKLKEIKINNNIDYSYNENEDLAHCNENKYAINSSHFCNNHEVKNDYKSDQYSRYNEKTKSSYLFNDKIYNDKMNEKKLKEFEESYINKLNDEITKIRGEQEQMINEKCKDIYAYSKSNINHIIIPGKNGSFLIKNVDSTEYDENMIEGIINEKRNKINSQMCILKKKKNKKEDHKNLSSMNTKGSLGLNNSNIDENIPHQNVYLNRTLVK